MQNVIKNVEFIRFFHILQHAKCDIVFAKCVYPQFASVKCVQALILKDFFTQFACRVAGLEKGIKIWQKR